MPTRVCLFQEKGDRMRRSIRLIIIAAHDLSRNGLEALVNRADRGIQVIGAFRRLEDAAPYVARSEANVLLLDDFLPPAVNVHDVIQELRRLQPDMRLIVLSGRLNARYMRMLFARGVSGFLYREDQLEESLVTGIETVSLGHIYASLRAMGLLFSQNGSTGKTELNQTDMEVLRLIDRGLTPKEIAARLRVTRRTVYRSRAKLCELLGVPSKEHIVAAARRKGLLEDRDVSK